jgi:hypothetical protein
LTQAKVLAFVSVDWKADFVVLEHMYSRLDAEDSTDVVKLIAQATKPKNTLQSLLGRAPWKIILASLILQCIYTNPLGRWSGWSNVL